MLFLDIMFVVAKIRYVTCNFLKVMLLEEYIYLDLKRERHNFCNFDTNQFPIYTRTNIYSL